jgi:hypothetical protein
MQLTSTLSVVAEAVTMTVVEAGIRAQTTDTENSKNSTTYMLIGTG